MAATENNQQNDQRLSTFLGWFSIGLGVAELAAPRVMAKVIGVRNRTANHVLLRAYGAREIAAGIGILLQRRQPAWLWARVGGDALDLASLGSVLASDSSHKVKASIATAAVAGVTALDVICAQKLSASGRQSGPRRFVRTVLINRAPADVYAFWRNLSNLPQFMDNLESVEDLGNNRSLWRARATRGRTVEWQAEIVDDQPERSISWRSIEGALVSNSGTVQFAAGPGGRGTMLRVEIEYQMPGGNITANLARLINSEPGQQVADELRRLKMVLETGEVVRSDASIHPGMHPAQPPEEAPADVFAASATA